MITHELRPCPFCGKEPETFLKKVGLHDYRFEIVCPRCGCMRYSAWQRDAHIENLENFPSFQEVLDKIENAIDYWNTRVYDEMQDGG